MQYQINRGQLHSFFLRSVKNYSDRASRHFTQLLALAALLLAAIDSTAGTTAGTWLSMTTGEPARYTVKESPRPAKDYAGNYITVVYLENLRVKKIGRNTNPQNVKWLLSQGYRVIEIDYRKHPNTISPKINAEIIAINDSIAAGSFCGLQNCSRYQSYVLFEGYRIARNVPYFEDDPGVYNTPEEYTKGDMLHMDIIYPANPSTAVSTILSFSYSNSYATYDAGKKMLTDANKDQRLHLGNTLAGFNDSFLEGAPAEGMAWAIADHPKYCPWGKGKPKGGKNDTYKSYETNPDAVRKVKSAIRTLRALGRGMGLSGRIGIFGFSRGSTAGSLAIGDRKVAEFENAGFNHGVSDAVQAAALGPGVFNYTWIYHVPNDGDSNLEIRCPWAWGPLDQNYALWESMGASYLAKTSATAPVLFFYNTDDERYYQDQVTRFKSQLDSLKVPNSILFNYGTGHSIPQTDSSLTCLYNFFKNYLYPPQEIRKRRKGGAK
ncbi:alpha/beta hydrolase family protein [Arcticibacter sp. MXS-1]|uniref:alpha/beta hydrolase family protein n=1 Tax=Arcticibacter sp. MXS-1 TaxID=3341726 RepID=UPI0035A959AA